MVIPGVLGTVTMTGYSFAITGYSIDGGFNFIEVGAYGGPGCEEFIQALQRTGVTLRGYFTEGDAKFVPVRGQTAVLSIDLNPTGGPSGGRHGYIDTVLPGPATWQSSYKGTNEYSLTVGHASGSSEGPKYLRS